MPTPVSYLSGASLSNTVGMFKRGTMAQNLKSSLESGYNWWNGIDITSSQYLIYSDTYTMGTSTQANSIPVAWSTPDLTDQSLLNLINTLPPRVGQTAFTSLPIALQWLQSSNKFFLIRGGTENIVKSNLKLYVDAGRYDSYSGTSTTWGDLSGSGNNGTLTNGTSYNTSGVGSMVFDGTNDYVDFGNPVSLQITNALTVDVWLRVDSTSDFTTAVAKSNGATGGWTVQLRDLVDEWRFWVNFGTNVLGNGSNNGWYYANFPKTWNDGKWHHFVGIWDGTSKTVKLYIDGIQGTFNAGGNPSGESSSIGNYNGNLVAGSETGGNNPLDGNISSLKIYNVALSPEEVLQNFNAQKLRFGYYDIVQSGLTLNLDATNYLSYPRSGTTWTDLTGSGNNGTLTNGPTFSGGTTPSVVFDGADDFVVCPPTSAWGNNPFTLISWCYPEFDSYVYGAPMLTKAVDCSGGIEWAFEYGRQTNKFSIYGGSFPGGPVKYGTNIYPKNNWYHACVTYDGTNLTFYINGSQDSTSTGFYPGNGNGQIALGTYYGCGPVNEWLGKISTGQVYNRALTPQEVIQNYESQRVNFGTTGITTNGLVLNLDAANTASYGGSGTVWRDISGGGNDGILTNGPTYSNSGATSNFVFDGTDDYVINSNFNITPINNELSISLWYRTTNNATEKMLIDLCGTSNTTSNRDFFSIRQNWQSNNKISCYFNSTSGFQYVAFPNQVVTNTWNNIVYTKVGNTLYAYLNGSNVATQNVSGNIQTIQRYVIANDNLFQSNLFAGNMANVLIYNRGLSASEVLQNYNATKGRFGL